MCSLSHTVRFQITNDDLCLKSPCKANTGLDTATLYQPRALSGEGEWKPGLIPASLKKKLKAKQIK